MLNMMFFGAVVRKIIQLRVMLQYKIPRMTLSDIFSRILKLTLDYAVKYYIPIRKAY